MARRRPTRSEYKPNSVPPVMAPIMEITLTIAVIRGLKWRRCCRNVGYRSCVPCERKFIMAISSHEIEEALPVGGQLAEIVAPASVLARPWLSTLRFPSRA